MMQSLLLNGTASIKSNELKNQEENDPRINSLKSSKLAEQQRNFAKVMQDNIDKENAKTQSRHAARSLEDNRDNIVEVKKPQSENIIAADKVVNENSSEKKLTTVDNKKADKNKGVDENTKLSNTPKSDDSEIKSEEGSDVDLSEQLSAETEVDNILLEMDVNEGDETELNEFSEEEVELADSNSITTDISSIESKVMTQDDASLLSAETEENINANLNENLDSQLDPTGQHSLLSQIEAAQQVDTKVNKKEGEPSEMTMSMLKGQPSSVDIDDKKNQSLTEQLALEPELEGEVDGEISVKAKLASEVETGSKSKSDPELESKVDADSEKKPKFKLTTDVEPNKELNNTESGSELDAALQTLKPAEKADQLSTLLKNENAVANQTAVDVNGARTNQTNQVQLDKLMAFNQQAPTANNLLQEPLDIQSKHAAAMMGERVMMMLSQGKQEVEIRLDPAELGSMLIKMQVKQDQVQLHIQTQAGLSKDIIEQNMPRLREQLAQQGIQLSEANVQQQSQQQSQQQRQNQINNASGQLTNAQEVVNDQKNVFIPSKIPSLEQGIDYYV